MKFKYIIVLSIVLLSCGKDEHDVQKTLNGTWNIDQTATPDNAPVDAVPGGYITFSEDGSGYLKMITETDTIESGFLYNVTWFNNTQWFTDPDPAQNSDHIHAQSLSLYNLNDYNPSTGVYRCVNSDGCMYFKIAYIKKRKGKLVLFYDTDDNNLSSYSNYSRSRTYYYCSLQ